MIRLDLGDIAELEAKVTNTRSAEAADPAEPTFRVLAPSGDTEDIEATKVEAGLYRAEFTPTESGIHEWLFIGSGTNALAGEGRFRVLTPRVPRD